MWQTSRNIIQRWIISQLIFFLLFQNLFEEMKLNKYSYVQFWSSLWRGSLRKSSGCGKSRINSCTNIRNVYLASTASLLYQDWRRCASNRCHRLLVFWKAQFLYSRIDSGSRYEHLTKQICTSDWRTRKDGLVSWKCTYHKQFPRQISAVVNPSVHRNKLIYTGLILNARIM